MTTHAAFIAHMDLARQLLEARGRHVTEAAMLRVMRTHTADALRQLLEGR